MDKAKKGWKEIPIGGLIIEAGNSVNYKTGGWRSLRPVLDKEKCINCMLCWVYCPDNSIEVVEGKVEGFDFDYCKGCGVCANVCPKGAITMIPEPTEVE